MDEVEIGGRKELLVETRRLARTFLNRIEEGSKDGSLDQDHLRMLGSLALRSLRLWNEIVRTRKRESLVKAEVDEIVTSSGSWRIGVEGRR